MSMDDLQPNGLYIMLFCHDFPHLPNKFHWSLYLHRNSSSGGTKYHIRNHGLGWIADHGPASRVFTSFLLIGLVRIADVRAGLESHVDGVMRTYDAELNVPGRTCRLWLLSVLALLQKPVADGGAVLKCSDLGAL